ncbi:MAG TPA: STAS domain-containing protein [bacterium]|nr:STAS domain-containing protein [bacterium]
MALPLTIVPATLPDGLRLALTGRLNAQTSPLLQAELAAALAAGHRRVELDLAAVPFMSSAGIRVLQEGQLGLQRLKGSLQVVVPSPFVREALEAVGLFELLVPPPPAPAPAAVTVAGPHWSAAVTVLHDDGEFTLQRAGTSFFAAIFPAFALICGSGTPGDDPAAAPGLLLAAGGYAAYQCPADDFTPDYLIHAEEFVPRLCLHTGFRLSGEFAQFADCTADQPAGFALDELTGWLMQSVGGTAVGFAAAAEMTQVAGTAHDFVAVQYDSCVALVVGLAGCAGDAACQAAIFRYAPLRAGRQKLPDAAAAMFEQPLLGICRLAPATRFRRGACWFAPVGGA